MCHHRYDAYDPVDDREAVDVPEQEEVDPEAATPADDD